MIGYDVFCVCDNNIGLCLCIIVKKDVFFFLIDNILNKVSGVIGVVKIVGEISFLVEFILVFWLVNEYVFFLCVFFYFKSKLLMRNGIDIVFKLFFENDVFNYLFVESMVKVILKNFEENEKYLVEVY